MSNCDYEEEELLSPSTSSLAAGVTKPPAKRFVPPVVVAVDDDDDVQFVATPVTTLSATALKTQRFAPNVAARPAAAASSSGALPAVNPIVSAVLASEANQTDIEEEAERLLVDVPSDVDAAGDKSAYQSWRDRHERRRLLGRLDALSL